ncbi:MAG: AsnC family transcriptional regulator [Candidatus Meridianibacter frigidus]|nr:MAG: AsnC family transcriptional regulator [Candidatus Eremiobacteraeota bacterium]
MDVLDGDILCVLEGDARISYAHLSDKVGLSANAVAERVRRLHEVGVIRRFTAEIDSRHLGVGLQALIEVKMESGVSNEQFEKITAATPGVIRALVTTGRYDWLLEVIAVDQHDLQRIIESLRSGGLTRDTYSRIVTTDRRFKLSSRLFPRSKMK